MILDCWKWTPYLSRTSVICLTYCCQQNQCNIQSKDQKNCNSVLCTMSTVLSCNSSTCGLYEGHQLVFCAQNYFSLQVSTNLHSINYSFLWDNIFSANMRNSANTKTTVHDYYIIETYHIISKRLIAKNSSQVE
jgi:hypothetical protein